MRCRRDGFDLFVLFGPDTTYPLRLFSCLLIIVSTSSPSSPALANTIFGGRSLIPSSFLSSSSSLLLYEFNCCPPFSLHIEKHRNHCVSLIFYPFFIFNRVNIFERVTLFVYVNLLEKGTEKEQGKGGGGIDRGIDNVKRKIDKANMSSTKVSTHKKHFNNNIQTQGCHFLRQKRTSPSYPITSPQARNTSLRMSAKIET